MLPVAFETKPEAWHYLNEGGANVVYAFRDSGDPRYGGKVLRVPKDIARPDNAIASEGEQRREAQRVFEEQVLPALVAQEYLVAREKVLLPAAWLRALEAATEESRPQHRRHAQPSLAQQGISLSDGVQAELLDNLIGGRGVLALEIKPKWGFLPNPTHLSEASRAVKTSHCRFCMHRHLRSVKDKGSFADNHLGASAVVDDDGYCPLDLYSGQRDRVARAVDALWRGYEDTRGLGNNLRIYLDGRQVSPDAFAGDEGSTIHVDRACVTSALAETFAASSVLADLAKIQRRLDPIDIEGVLAKLGGRAGAARDEWVSSPLLAEPSPAELATLIGKLRGSSSATADETDGGPGWSTRDHVLAYLLSATFKDCSLIVRFDVPGGFDAAASLRRTAIKLIDLDLKSLSKFSKWVELDHQIWKTYLDRVERSSTGRICREEFGTRGA